MKTLRNNKTLLLVILLIIVFVAVYKTLFQSDLDLTADSTSQTVGDEVLTMYNSLKQVNFDASIFSTPSYLLLNDFSTEIPPQTTGRRNPFDTIGRN